ncbi:unnamed protein product [Effrenium voratum]|nr:unnamed protein product [Effrenium voratum]
MEIEGSRNKGVPDQDSHDVLSGWTMRMRAFLRLTCAASGMPFRDGVAMKPDMEEREPSSPPSQARKLRFGESSFISPAPSLTHAHSSTPTSPKAVSFSSVDEEGEEEEAKATEFMEAIAARRHRTRQKFSVACVRSQEAPPMQSIKPQMSNLWQRRKSAKAVWAGRLKAG